MRWRLMQAVPPNGAGGGGAPLQAPMIPTPPGVAPQGPRVEYHQPNTQIPAPPDVFFQQARAAGAPIPGTQPQAPAVPPSNAAQDFWGAMGVDGDVSGLPPPFPPPSQDPSLYPPAQPQQQPQQLAQPQQPYVPQAPVQQPAAVAPVPAQGPLPTANDPFDINRMLEGISIPAPQQQQPSAAPPQQPQQFAPQAQPVAPQSPAPPTREALQEQAIAQLMPRYTLSAEDDRGMISEPGRVLPRIAAHLHLAVAQDVAQAMHTMLPALIQQHTHAALGAQRAEMEFFGRFPALNKPEFRPFVAQSLALVRQMNPQATREDVITRGAMLAATEIRSRFMQRVAQPQSSAQPYVPPNGGSPAPVSGIPGAPGNIWQELSQGEINPW